MRVLLCCLVIGCYSPRPPSGAPCSTSCPGGEVCVDGFCTIPGAADAGAEAEAAVDAANDRDGDGVADELDLCPEVADPAQYDEDGDALGDACDPCPPVPGGEDGDGDGLGDACDPRPGEAGDQLLLFEGFGGPVPAGWTVVGDWTTSGGFAEVTVGNDERAFLAPPLAPGVATAAFTEVTPLALHGLDPRGIGVANPLARDGTLVGIECELFRNASSNSGRFGLVNLANGSIFASRPLDFTLGTPYTLGIVRLDDEYSCAVSDGSAPELVRNDAVSAPAQPAIALRTRSISGRFAWLMIVAY